MIKRLLRKFQDPEERRAEEKARTKRLLESLSKIEAGQGLFSTIDIKKLYVRYDEAIPVGEARFRAPYRVKLSPLGTEIEQALSTAHELRHYWQEKQGLTLTKASALYDNLIMMRFAEADAFSFETQVAWELDKLEPEKGYWRKFKRNYKDLCRAFEKSVEQSAQNADNGKAQKAAFNAWFAMPLRKQYDYNALKQVRDYWYRKSQGIRNGLVFHKKRGDDEAPLMSEEFLREFGQRADGSNYLAGVNLYSDYYIGNTTNAMERSMERTIRKYPDSDNSLIYDQLVPDA